MIETAVTQNESIGKIKKIIGKPLEIERTLKLANYAMNSDLRLNFHSEIYFYDKRLLGCFYAARLDPPQIDNKRNFLCIHSRFLALVGHTPHNFL